MKTAFVLSGEGARGGYQAGTMQLLADQGVIPDEIHGISSGSLNAVGYSCLGPEGLVEQWRKIDDIKKVFTFNTFSFLWKTGAFSPKPTSDLIKRIVYECNPMCEAVVSRLNVHNGDIERVSNMRVSKDEFIEASIAALSIPGVVEARGEWVDAGARELAPLKYVINKGVENIIVILGRPLEIPYWVSEKWFLKIIDYGYRFIDLMLFEILIRDIKSCIKKNLLPGYKNVGVTVYGPNEYIFDSLEFSQSRDGLEYGLEELNEIDINN